MMHKRIHDKLLSLSKGHIITDFIMGLGYTAIEIDSKSLGISYTFTKELQFESCNVFKNAGKLIGCNASVLSDYILSYNLLDATVALALSNAILNKQTDGGDFIHLIKKSDKVVMIGYFEPLINAVRASAANLIICERDEKKNSLPDYAAYFELRNADVAIISATTLINKTIDSLIESAKHARIVAIVGPSCLMDKSIFEDTSVTHLCGITITDIKKTKEIISQGGGTKALKYYTKKECVMC